MITQHFNNLILNFKVNKFNSVSNNTSFQYMLMLMLMGKCMQLKNKYKQAFVLRYNIVNFTINPQTKFSNLITLFNKKKEYKSITSNELLNFEYQF